MTTDIRHTELPGVVELIPPQICDERGFFSEVYNREALCRHGIELTFVQDNHSLSCEVGVLRGLHYQLPPFSQAKLVRVLRGAAFDVAVDIRKGSPTYKRWVGVKLSASKWNQLLIPEGFAHGFLTLEPNTEFLYKVTQFYSEIHDRSIRFDDPDIGVEWPLPADLISTSAKDRDAPLLTDAENNFLW